jgi:hypothetical protein
MGLLAFGLASYEAKRFFFLHTNLIPCGRYWQEETDTNLESRDCSRRKVVIQSRGHNKEKSQYMFGNARREMM